MSPEAPKEIWTVLRLLGWTQEFFKKQGIEGARRQAEDLLCHVLELDRLHLYLQFEYVPTPSELALFRNLVRRRTEHEPLQYLLGWQPFFHLRVKVDRRVLIPRPETEHLCGRLAAYFKGKKIKAADVCTGSGCIALGLASVLDGHFWATDKSGEALALARENAESLGLADKTSFLLGDLLAPLAQLDDFDLIVSNPPYIAESERGKLSKDVVDFEPHEALFGGIDGLDFLRPLVFGSAGFLKQGGLLALECGLGQAETLSREADPAVWQKVWIEKDLSGKERYFFSIKA